MKTNVKKKTTNGFVVSLCLAISLLTLALYVSMCRKPTELPLNDQKLKAATSPQTALKTQTCGTPLVKNLLAGQNIIAGTVSISNDASNLYVTYNTSGGWELQKTHLYVGDCALVPKNRSGNPVVGLFPYQTTYSPRATSFTYTISLTSLANCYCVFAHSEVVKTDGGSIVIQSETGWGQGDPFGGSTWAQVMNYCTQKCIECVINPGDYRTQTQGGWGADSNGNNSGAYLHNNFSAAFSGGLIVGCSTGYTISLTSAQAVTDFLPQGGTAASLTQSYVNPTDDINVFAGQVVTLALSVGFDSYDSNFGSSSSSLGGLIVAAGIFQGWTVNQLLEEANKVLGGCSSSYSVTDLNAALDAINNNFDNGTVAGSYLICSQSNTKSKN